MPDTRVGLAQARSLLDLGGIRRPGWTFAIFAGELDDALDPLGLGAELGVEDDALQRRQALPRA
jgi:hypothetical protein